MAKPTLLTIHFREHRAEVVKHPPLQHFLYKFSDFVNDRPHELGEQARKLWNHRLRHNYNAAARHKLCYPQLVGTITLNSGRRSSKNIYEIFKNLPDWGRSFSDLLHFRDWFQIKMNFNRNVSCLIAVYFFMDNDFFNQLV